MSRSLADRLQDHPLLSSLSGRDRAELARASTVRLFARREVVFRTGDESDAVRLLLSGSVRVFHTSPEGIQATVKLFKAPGMFGEVEVIAGVPFGEDVAALEPSEIVRVPKDCFLRLVSGNAELSMSLLRHVCACFSVAAHTEAAMAFGDVRSRLAQLLIDYTRLGGACASGGRMAVRPQLALTQDDMADALGVTRRAVAKEIARWQRLGVLERRAGRYIVCRADVLGGEGAPGRYSISYVMGGGPSLPS